MTTHRCAALLAAMLALGAGSAAAQGLSAFVSPARFEITGKAGETRRHVLEIHHSGRDTGRFSVYTNDWEFQPDMALRFSDALGPESCRTWVALERRELSVAPNARYRFRFEITPPADTPARECRFAIMVEGAQSARVVQEGLTFPVSGRLGVIVYVSVGGAQPKLALGAGRVLMRDGERLPVIEVTNSGNAHGRLEGFVNGKDAAGREFELSPEDAPILPGRTRAIALRPVEQEGRKQPPIQYPLSVKGTVEWGKSRESLDLRFAP